MSATAAGRVTRCLLFFVLILVSGGAQAARRPNIVVMMTDDQRWDALGVVQREQGSRGRFPWLRTATPNLDRIAAEGYRFRNAFVVSSLCSPSRAAFLTGRYNHLNGVANNQTPFPVTNSTYATLLRDSGYRTGYFGKWHMARQRERPGFDEHASYIGQGIYTDANFQVNGALTRTTGWVDDVATTYAAGFIRRHVAEPFVMVLGFKSPHHPSTPPPRLAGHFDWATLAPTANAESYAPYDPSPVPADLPVDYVRDYFRSIVGVDQNVGRVLDVLDETGIADDTVVVFASDNGFFLGEHGIGTPVDPDGNKRNAYEESMRIPLLVRYPRLPGRGVAIGDRALNIDLAPTLLELAGTAIPASLQGKSWVPQLNGSTVDLRGRFLYEYFFETGYEVPTLVALRRWDHKLIRYPGHPGWQELFHVGKDPGEQRNLAGDPASQTILRTMNDALDAEMRAMKYVVPPYAHEPNAEHATPP